MKIRMQSNRMSWFKIYHRVMIHINHWTPTLGSSNSIWIKTFLRSRYIENKNRFIVMQSKYSKTYFYCVFLVFLHAVENVRLLLAFVHPNVFIKICGYFNNAQRDIGLILKVHHITFSFTRGASHWFAYLLIFNNSRRSPKEKNGK